ncbi:AhpC/TSA domain-containing protein [Ceratobasidium sp. AG-Ba]|nr:AhpC/TSA domain-containing protein [Ceratobasidium sp. AG-Ba]
MSSPKALVGKPAPAVTLSSATGEQFELNPATSGQPTVIFFFPAAGTYGCTKEVCSFRDALSSNPLYKTHNVQIIGISADKVAKQKSFVDAQGIPFPMLCDVDGEARKKYNVGKGMLGLTEARVTFCVDKEGVVREFYDSMLNFTAHEKHVTKWLSTLPTSETEAAAPDSAPEPAPEA